MLQSQETGYLIFQLMTEDHPQDIEEEVTYAISNLNNYYIIK